MGCVSSNLLNQEDEFAQLGSSALGHHIVSLTSTTYGLLTLDPPSQSATTPPTPPPPFRLGSTFSESKSLWSEPRPIPTRPEVINSWELMSGLDADSFRFSPIPSKENLNLSPNFTPKESAPKPPLSRSSLLDKFQADSFRFPNTLPPEKENANPNLNKKGIFSKSPTFSRSSLLDKFESGDDAVSKPSPLDKFEHICPPNGENRVVIYTTTLRGIRKTFEDCNAVRSAIESYGIAICERDISMDRGFREELREIMKEKDKESTPPRVFIKGRYIGGAEEVIRIVDEGWFGDLLHGLPKKRAGGVCDGCGDVKFLPCFRCNGSCKIAVVVKEEEGEEEGRRPVVVRCTECNENGLVHCPICS
ncbi:Glutaredoxin [Corchorus olitorius]|uniref:Glutaredoxin n=1 Tax=Corchorus olitorius TaxID=93759 RepID=A0A1R3K6W5_9ROSI|nr:Glutaredoxin [Corchorus olitorius]